MGRLITNLFFSFIILLLACSESEPIEIEDFMPPEYFDADFLIFQNYEGDTIHLQLQDRFVGDNTSSVTYKRNGMATLSVNFLPEDIENGLEEVVWKIDVSGGPNFPISFVEMDLLYNQDSVTNSNNFLFKEELTLNNILFEDVYSIYEQDTQGFNTELHVTKESGVVGFRVDNLQWLKIE